MAASQAGGPPLTKIIRLRRTREPRISCMSTTNRTIAPAFQRAPGNVPFCDRASIEGARCYRQMPADHFGSGNRIVTEYRAAACRRLGSPFVDVLTCSQPAIVRTGLPLLALAVATLIGGRGRSACRCRHRWCHRHDRSAEPRQGSGRGAWRWLSILGTSQPGLPRAPSHMESRPRLGGG